MSVLSARLEDAYQEKDALQRCADALQLQLSQQLTAASEADLSSQQHQAPVLAKLAGLEADKLRLQDEVSTDV